MRLLSLHVRNYRVHQDISLTFDPSRNLIGGPNESGKSTLAEAIHRTLFLRAKTGGGLRKEMISTHLGGDPEISLGFEACGHRWEIQKRFAGPKGSARLTHSDGSSFRDDEAETRLAEILRCDTQGGRLSASQLPLVWSHLWVWQGSSGEDPAAHARAHKDTLVQRLQQEGVAAVMQSATDQRVRERVGTAYAELFTATGKPKAGSKPEIARLQLEEAEAALLRARETGSRLEQAVIDHTRAEREIADADTALPSLRAGRGGTEAKLTQAGELKRMEEVHLRALESASLVLNQAAAADTKIRGFHQQAAGAREGLDPAEKKQASLAAEEQNARSTSETAAIAQRQSADALRKCRFHQDLAIAVSTAFEKSETHQRLAARHAEAEVIRDDLNILRGKLSQLPPLAAKELAKFRQLERETAQATTSLEAMATGIELVASNTTVTLDEKALAAGDFQILTDTGDLVIGNHARLRIRPGGGGSLADARARHDSARRAWSDALDHHALRDLDHAATVFEQRQSLEQQIAQCETRWKALGGEALAIELAAAKAALDAAEAEVRRRKEILGSGDSATPGNAVAARDLLAASGDNLAAAETAEASARRSAEHTRAALEAASQALQRHCDLIATSRQDLRDLETSIKVLEENHGDVAARQLSLARAREAEQQAATRLAASRRDLSALAPETLSADLDRFTRAIGRQEAARREAEDRRLTARTHLILDGSSDPGAEHSHALARCQAARELHASEQRRAKAIEKLHQLFSSSREAIDRSLVQPLTDRISGYLRCLFGPGAGIRVNLSEGGIEGLELIRTGDPAFGFASLSGGAREQVAAAVRLAMAEILAAEHDGCLPVLFDDAFAYTDPERTQSLQRMLNLAALRGLQVIVLTCTPNDYSAFGASEIRMGG